MRLEAIEKEADMYKGDGECYIHIERTKNTPIKIVAAGDPSAMAQSIYNLLCQLADDMGRTLPDMLKLFKKAYRQFGVPEHRDMET